MLFSIILLVGFFGFIGWMCWGVISTTIKFNRRIKRIKELQEIVCSTQYSDAERQAAFEEIFKARAEGRR